MREATVTGCPLSDNTPQFLQLRNTPISISTQNRKSPFSSTQPSPSQPAEPSENTLRTIEDTGETGEEKILMADI